MPTLVICVGNIFRAVRRESHRQNPVQGIIGVLGDCPGGRDALNPVAGAVIVVDCCPGVRVAFLNHVAESIINVGGRNSGRGGNGQRTVMRIVARCRDPAGRVRDLVETVQRVERALCRVHLIPAEHRCVAHTSDTAGRASYQTCFQCGLLFNLTRHCGLGYDFRMPFSMAKHTL